MNGRKLKLVRSILILSAPIINRVNLYRESSHKLDLPQLIFNRFQLKKNHRYFEFKQMSYLVISSLET